MKFLKEAGLEKSIFFHVSDEPMPDNIEYYRNAKNIIKGEIGDCPSGDPLAHYDFFEDGSVQITDCTFATVSNSVNTFAYSSFLTPAIVLSDAIPDVRLIRFAGNSPLFKKE